jgi:uncharacterized repeat protein (TIGR04076 family)
VARSTLAYTQLVAIASHHRQSPPTIHQEGQCQSRRAGQWFKFPDEKGKICPWLMDSMNGAIRVLEYGGTMPWLYEGTPYQKVIDPNGLTTEFIRCPDPSRVVVAKISRRRV